MTYGKSNNYILGDQEATTPGYPGPQNQCENKGNKNKPSRIPHTVNC